MEKRFHLQGRNPSKSPQQCPFQIWNFVGIST